MVRLDDVTKKFGTGEYRLTDTPILILRKPRAAYYRNRFIGFVFQSFNLLPFKNGLDNVVLPLYFQCVGLRDVATQLPLEAAHA